MSDKSFGDYTNRNIVKNSLLSTAVTGLSIEDLTHNAVLVPVAPNQGMITGSDITGSHTQALGDTDNEIPSSPYGDTNTNTQPTQPFIPTHTLTQTTHTIHQNSQKAEQPIATVSKAFDITEDDFDVNEYFARLQGTRYVSAPLHGHSDPNANLPPAEENLEEINLNDDKSVEVPQSLTADIAQNFSQLPNVLPHVASAVFSSFSNMWNMKSREVTPDDRVQNYLDDQIQRSQGSNQFQSGQGSQSFGDDQRNQGQSYQDVQFQGSQVFDGSSIPLMRVDDVREVGLPPKEPPACGNQSFRLTTKKKYAQIPGLSTGQSQPIGYNPISQQIPSYFTPTEIPEDKKSIEDDIHINPVQTIKPPSATSTATIDHNNDTIQIIKPPEVTAAPNEQSNPLNITQHRPDTQNNPPATINLQNYIPDIPPPPTTSMLRRDSATDKSFLPPSVARRLGAKPLIKQPILQPTNTDNIFVPTFDPNAAHMPTMTVISQMPTDNSQMFAANTQTPQTHQNMTPILPPPTPQAAFIPDPLITASMSSPTLPSQLRTSNKPAEPVPQVLNPASSFVAPAVFTPVVPDNASTSPYLAQGSILNPMDTNTYISSVPSVSTQPDIIMPPLFPPQDTFAKPTDIFNRPPSNLQTSVPTGTKPLANIGVPPLASSQNQQIVPSVATGPCIPTQIHEQPKQESTIPLFPFPQANITATPDITKISQPPPEPPKPLIEPPKVMGANFRMTKKRPQYYSGPIEGVGSISNSIKPIIPTVESGTFQGSLFTPEQGIAEVNTPSFDLNVQTQATVPYTPAEITPTSIPTASYPTQANAYPNYEAPIQDYSQQYNTAFDVSMPAAANLQQVEEPTQSKGFGIIGSLKSKLSNLDINKIQNTVTTFFDPAYNNTKKDPTDAKENSPFNPTPYESYGQTNFDIFVPNVDQYQTSTYNPSDNNPYGYSNTGYTNFYNYEQQNTVYVDPKVPSQSYPTNLYTEQVRNTEQISTGNIFTQNTTVGDTVFDKIGTPYEDKSKSEPVASTEPASTEFNQNIQPVNVFTDNRPPEKEIIEERISNEGANPKAVPTIEPIGFETVVRNVLGIQTETANLSLDKLTSVSQDEIPKSLFEIPSNYDNAFGGQGNKPEILNFDTNKPVSIFDTPLHAFEKVSQEIKNSIIEKSLIKEDIVVKSDLLESLTKLEAPILGVTSVPLFGLSAIVSDKSKSVDLNRMFIPEIENDTSFFDHKAIEKNEVFDVDPNACLSFFDESLREEIFDTKSQIPVSSFFNKDIEEEVCDIARNVDMVLDSDNKTINLFENVGALKEEFGTDTILDNVTEKSEESNVSELNICETCREVNKPEDKSDREDVTYQLIENITSPILLSNAVEVPLGEGDNVDRRSTKEIEFDAAQYDEISHITEETIETIHVNAETELLDDEDNKTSNYGWTTNDNSSTNTFKYPDYAYTVDSKSIGFFGQSLFGENVPANASDEIKAEFKIQEDLAPRKKSAASAPPASEDLKSYEAGTLDVQSIELDAKEDFPIYEEFVIEPSETDDDKIEYKEREKTEESDFDSFTDRVEKYKKMDGHSHPISMASYFDTGNFAADTHYRNTMTSPSSVSIPPGFEEEFKKRLALAKANEPSTHLPDTITQRKTSFSHNIHTSDTLPIVKPFGEVARDLTSPSTTSPIMASHIFNTPFTTQQTKELATPTIDFHLPTNVMQVIDDNLEMPNASAIFAPESPSFPVLLGIHEGPDSKSASDITWKPQTVVEPKANLNVTSEEFDSGEPNISKPFEISNLTAPIPSDKPTEPKINDPKLPDPMNFFADTNTTEVPAESFNRLASYFNSPPKTEHAKSFFELSQSQNHYRHAIDQDRYKDLMKDLTSVRNFTVSDEQKIRQVNYFTVDYDDVKPDIENLNNIKDNIQTDKPSVYNLANCVVCLNLLGKNSDKVRTAMDDTSGSSSGVNRDDGNAKNAITSTTTLNFDGIEMPRDSNVEDMLNEHRPTADYSPVKHHWFYRVDIEDKSIWRGFSVLDSKALETAFLSPDLTENTVVPTDGGRYDVNIVGRIRIPVYWKDKPNNVIRCSWFYKGTTDPRFVPYAEDVAEKLETEYRHGLLTGEWHRRLPLANGEIVVMHGPSVMVHFQHMDAFNTAQQSTSRPRVVRRLHDESEVEDPEPSKIDHLLLLCHGVGSACDMRFRSVEEVVEDFRTTSIQLVQSHYKNSYDQGIVSRVEVLPISWHETLHSGETGVDRRLAQITLDSIPRLRNFTNDTVLDVLFYTSPVFCQTILNTVCQEMNRIYELFKKRNPDFKGGISLGGHSLGSVILYDLLCHQSPENFQKHQTEKSYLLGPAGTGQPTVKYPELAFKPDALYALGSPIAIFECIRGVETLGQNFALPTCKNFFNIFHPYDPIAYRIEPLINPLLRGLKPYLIPHHKGRKRMHLELKDTMARVGADLKQKLVESLRSTWNKWKSQPTTEGTLERVVEEEIEKEKLYADPKEDIQRERELSTPEMLGRLNGGRRVDYVLQEAPLEIINEYLFAMRSHVGYWESEDTMLLMLREIYSSLGIQPDSTVPQQNMTVERTRIRDSCVVNTDFPSTSGAHRSA